MGMQRISAPKPFGEKWTHKTGKPIPEACRALPVSRHGCLRQMTVETHQWPCWWYWPMFTQGSPCPDPWRQTDNPPCPGSCSWGNSLTHFKLFSFLGKAYATSSHFFRGSCNCQAPCAHSRPLCRPWMQKTGVTPGLLPSCLAGFHPSSPSSGLALTLYSAGISLNKHALTRKLQPIPARNWASLTSIWSNVIWCSVIHLPASHLFLLQNLRRCASL